MVVRFFSALAWFSVVFSFLVFLISYANYPDEVLVYINGAGEPIRYISKNIMFYLPAAFLLVINMVYYGLKKISQRNNENSDITQVSLVLSQIFYNLFFASSVYFISILNSRENFNYSNFGYLIYVTGLLLAVSVLMSIFARFIFKK